MQAKALGIRPQAGLPPKMAELLLSKQLVHNLRRFGAHVQRIEDKLSVGVPDINVALNGYEVWLELKEFTWPKRADTPVHIPLRPFQLAWIRARTQVGGIVYVVARETITGTVYVFAGVQIIGKDIHPLSLPKKDLIELASYAGTVAEAADIVISTLILLDGNKENLI